MNSKKISQLIVTALEDMKGQSIRCINVEKLTTITDFMVIVTGTSNTHIRALADAVVVKLKAANQSVVGIEGKMQSEWVLVDAGGVVVHIMMAPMRALYNLEDLWDFRGQSANGNTEVIGEELIPEKVSVKRTTRAKPGVKAKSNPRARAKTPEKAPARKPARKPVRKTAAKKRTTVVKAPA